MDWSLGVERWSYGVESLEWNLITKITLKFYYLSKLEAV